MPDALYAPWRMDYIKSLSKTKEDGCIFCKAAAATTPQERKAKLVLWDTPQVIVLINRYPYANGHLLVAPKHHKADLDELTEAEITDMGVQTAAAVKLLKAAVSAQGFNIGMNLGRVAGAGVPGHLHQHIVPRWGGDVNFMHVVGNVGIVPEANDQLWLELMRVRAEV